MSALVSAIRFVPEEHPSHTVYLNIFKRMAVAVAPAQAVDGSWRSSVLNHSFPPDSSGSSFMVFALAGDGRP
jgi:rhamnogalacturonyl hydrolase YesR